MPSWSLQGGYGDGVSAGSTIRRVRFSSIVNLCCSGGARRGELFFLFKYHKCLDLFRTMNAHRVYFDIFLRHQSVQICFDHSWRSLYNHPIECTADVQCRVVCGAGAMNTHRPQTRTTLSFLSGLRNFATFVAQLSQAYQTVLSFIASGGLC